MSWVPQGFDLADSTRAVKQQGRRVHSQTHVSGQRARGTARRIRRAGSLQHKLRGRRERAGADAEPDDADADVHCAATSERERESQFAARGGRGALTRVGNA